MTYKELTDEIEDLINSYFKENLKEYKFKDADAEEEVWVEVDDFISDTQDFIEERAKQIEYALNDNIKEETDQDMTNFIYNCLL